MKTLYVNAPIQNGDFNPDDKPGKVVPLLVARWMQKEAQNDGSSTHLWNNVSDQILAGSGSTEAESLLRLDQKYKSKILGNLACSVDIISDIDPDFSEWTRRLIGEMITKKSISMEKRSVHVCASCDSTIAHAIAKIDNGCRSCDVDNTYIDYREVLINKTQITEPANGGSGEPIAAESFRECILNKKRLLGVPLGEFGLDGYVLDPKIGVGLLAVYACEEQGFDEVTIVASRCSAKHNVQQTFSFLNAATEHHELPKLTIAPIAKAPVNYLQHLRESSVIGDDQYYDILQNILPPALISMTADMSPETAERLIFSRRKSNGIALR